MKPIRFILFTLSYMAIAFVLLPTSRADNSKPAALMFNKDIAPIFFKSCAECHRPGEAAPFSVLSYKNVRPLSQVTNNQKGHKESL